MPTGKQIRAARALVEWDADDLAKRIGMSRVAIQNIERGDAQPKPETMEKIVRAFSDSGIEFTGNQGIRLKPYNIETFEDKEGFVSFFEAVHAHLEANGGDICVSGVDEELFVKHQGDFAKTHMDRMAELTKANSSIKMRILIEEGDNNFVASHYATYKWLPNKFFSPTASYVFGDNLALISFSHDPAPLVILIKSAAFAETYRHSFNMAWDMATEATQNRG